MINKMKFAKKIIEYAERTRIKRELRRNKKSIDAFCEKMGSANQGLTENCPRESQLDTALESLLKERYDFEFPQATQSEVVCQTLAYPLYRGIFEFADIKYFADLLDSQQVELPVKVFSKRFYGNVFYDSIVDMYHLGFKWDIGFHANDGSNNSGMLSRELAYFFNTRDFLHIYQWLEQARHCPVGAFGFLVETQMRNFSENNGNRVYDAQVKRGLISGRLTFSGKEDAGYRFDSRASECGLEMVRFDLKQDFHSDSYSPEDYDKVLNWINANSRYEKK